jgi:hypothetical protein
MIFHLHFNTNTGDFEDHYIDLKPISPPSAEINDSSLFIVDAGKETLNYSHRPRPQQTTTSSTTIVVENNRTIGKTEPVVHGGGGGGGGCNSTSMPQRGAPWNPAKMLVEEAKWYLMPACPNSSLRNAMQVFLLASV